ncbi:MAG TPA: hypothetical protein PLS90_07520 [Candidatus Sumerlaeota bacterium]|nr:hypothetical protein [Candidatus Sumerlaeota bacterium]HOR28730.1 hypothetical protein [Candidatus Sumerlaeota bacterium]HPK02294.1 hypothetical protein [Candidatus Sumerlaeota bacterium]
MKSFRGLLLAAGVWSIAICAAAHGLHLSVDVRADHVRIAGAYENGTPLAGATVAIFAPQREEPYQEGRTDPAGRFAFIPDAGGRWRIRLDDSSGHVLERQVDIPAAGSPAASGPAAPPSPAANFHTFGLLVGVGLLAGISALAFWRTSTSK